MNEVPRFNDTSRIDSFSTGIQGSIFELLFAVGFDR
jgi:hypothetical protein